MTIENPLTNPPIHTEGELISQINILSKVVAMAIHKSKAEGESHGPEVVAALVSMTDNILQAAKIDPDCTLRLALRIVKKEIWETCHQQYGIQEEGSDASEKSS